MNQKIDIRCLLRPAAGVVVMGVLLSACRTSVPEQMPPITVASPVAQVRVTDTPSDSATVVHRWVSAFEDETYTRLVAEALRNSPNLKIALERMEGASQLARIARAGRLPSVSLNLNSNISDYQTLHSDPVDEYGFNVRTSWEIDLWGKVKNSSASSFAEWEASAFEFQYARQSIAASVGMAWYDLIAAYQQLELSKETLDSYLSTADLIKNRYESGIDSALDYRLAVANAEGAKTTLASREELYKRSQRSLQLLLGRYPDGTLKSATDFPALSETLPAGIPSDLLSRRPDVRAAERLLIAAESRVSSASKSRLPSISLTGLAGTQSSEFQNLMDEDYGYWRIDATISQPLYTGGQLDAAHKKAESAYRQAQALYDQVALQAFHEVEQGIDADSLFSNLESASKAAAEQASEAENLAREQYSAGLTNIVTVLEAQRRALVSKQNYIIARNSRIQNRIRLYLALGGNI